MCVYVHVLHLCVNMCERVCVCVKISLLATRYTFCLADMVTSVTHLHHALKLSILKQE